MKTSRFNRKLNIARNRFNKALNVEEQQIKEEELIAKLQTRLGKSREEVTNLVSDGLLSVLTKVPFTVSEK